MKPTLVTCLLLLLCAGISAQRIVPLGEIAEQREHPYTAPVMGLAGCTDPDLPGVERILTGAGSTVRVDLDTAGLGSDLTDYRCIGCDELRYGSVRLSVDTVFYTANAGVEQGLDTVGFTVCSATVCADTTYLTFLVQRPGRTLDLGNQLIQPDSVSEVLLPENELPGGVFCRTLAGCGTGYGGRGQRFDFLTDLEDGNDYTYEAARYGGTDTVCVVLCNEYGLCDTYRSTFTVDRAAVDLPFFDDFSYDGVRPEVSLWQDEDVLINRSYGVRPPSIGVATFDAVDYDGRPYAATGNGRQGDPRDYLTSVPIRMAGRSGAVLSFYVQPRGYGNRPEVADSFLVQFLSPAGNWTTVFQREGLLNTIPNSRFQPFTGETVPVPDAYLYDGFQFRFVNLSTESGAVDNWNLDYVKLSDQSTGLVTQDLALTDAPFRLIGPYTSLPVRHLRAGGEALLADSIFVRLWNHRADVTPITASEYRVTDLGSRQTVSAGDLIPSTYFGTDNGIAPAGPEVRGATFDQLPSYAAIRDYLLGLDPEQNYRLGVSYALTVATEDGSFAPGILRNSRASRTTELADYMAYDDGSAEVAIEGQSGNTILQRYTAYVADELTGIRIRLPRLLGAASEQPLTLVVYGAEPDGTPGALLHEADYPLLYAEDYYRDSLQAFTSYALTERVVLPPGDFFVGWRQRQANRAIAVGFDRNNELTEGQYFDAGNGWERLAGSTRGAIMIRPLLAGADIQPTDTDDPNAPELAIGLYPNPARDVLRLDLPAGVNVQELTVTVYDLRGRRMLRAAGVSELDVSGLPAGSYLMEFRVAGRSGRAKFARF